MEQLDRQGRVANMHNHGLWRVRIEFACHPRADRACQPVASTDTRGTIVYEFFVRWIYRVAGGNSARATTGEALIADRNGVFDGVRAVGPAERGRAFCRPRS